MAAASSAEKAVVGGDKQITDTNRRKDRQKAQMATQKSTPVKSDISYTSEEARRQREYDKMWHNQKSDWREELKEAMRPDDQGNHPYVDVMPFVNSPAEEARRQLKVAGKGAVKSKVQEDEDLVDAEVVLKEMDDIIEMRKSEKLGLGSPDRREPRSPTGYVSTGRSERRRKGAMGGRTHLSGGQPYTQSERGKKKNEPGSQAQRLNPPAKPKTRMTKNQILNKAMGYGLGRYQGD